MRILLLNIDFESTFSEFRSRISYSTGMIYEQLKSIRIPKKCINNCGSVLKNYYFLVQ